MSGHYVDLTGIPIEYIEFLGYIKIAEDEELLVLFNKGEEYIVRKSKPELYVDDVNDAAAFRNRRMTPRPPWS